MYRNSNSLLPVQYYNKLPKECHIDCAIVLEPVINTGRPRTKVWDEFDDDAVLAAKRYCRCKWCGTEVKADAARMYNHVTDRCPHIDVTTRQTYQAPDGNGPAESVSDVDDEAKESSAVVTNMNAGMKPEVGLVKAKGGRPKDPIWNEFSTNDDLRKRRYCMCIWCEKEVKGDTTRMTAHVLERCTVVDALTKAKYTVKFRKLHNDSTRVDHGDVLSSISATSTLSTSPTISKGNPPTAAMADVTALVPAPASPSLQHSTYPILHAESPPGLTLSKFGFLKELGLQDENRGVFGGGDWFGKGSVVTVVNPSTNESIATIQCGTMDDYMHVVETMDVAAITWRQASMERRSAVVHQIGDAFRSHQRSLAHLVSMELGIVLDESMRHIDMMIHTCDSAATAVRAIPGEYASTYRRPLHVWLMLQCQRCKNPLNNREMNVVPRR
ncbi:hypothetical protein DYB32_008345 [Aphanomyces invadans]|uniref:Aldehyde dehydrogenase domain-containing protein n=1 Tax=Aphanomyces invadans TaxID=157072 RepID=A0A418ALC6_9STRA|nr:hypothetical protein DYB32_008345 [Aphanomyces invadans]